MASDVAASEAEARAREAETVLRSIVEDIPRERERFLERLAWLEPSGEERHRLVSFVASFWVEDELAPLTHPTSLSLSLSLQGLGAEMSRR